jgi:hypothetical protein
MAHHWTARVVLVVGLACPMLSFADRPAETRDQATHVVVGRVEDVYAQEGTAGANRRLVVEIAIEDVERGGSWRNASQNGPIWCDVCSFLGRGDKTRQ